MTTASRVLSEMKKAAAISIGEEAAGLRDLAPADAAQTELRAMQAQHIAASRGDGSPKEYSEQDLEVIIARSKLPCSNLSALRSWVVLYDAKGVFYYLTINGYVQMPELRGSQIHGLKHALAAFPSWLVSFFKEVEDNKGNPRLKPLTQDEFLTRYARMIGDTRLVYDVDYGYIEDEDTLVIPAGRRTEIAPCYDADVERWLRAIANGREQQLKQ